MMLSAEWAKLKILNAERASKNDDPRQCTKRGEKIGIMVGIYSYSFSPDADLISHSQFSFFLMGQGLRRGAKR
jgi:hypothetical protein